MIKVNSSQSVTFLDYGSQHFTVLKHRNIFKLISININISIIKVVITFLTVNDKIRIVFIANFY